MNTGDKIRVLLEKYFEGETSLSEEKYLKEYFNSEEVAEELQQYQDLFQYFKSAKAVNFQGKIVVLEQTKAPRNKMFTWLSIAASIALLIGVWFYFKPDPTQETVAEIDWSKYEPDDPEEALRYTISAMQLLSQKLNGGAKKAARELDRIAEVEELILKKK